MQFQVSDPPVDSNDADDTKRARETSGLESKYRVVTSQRGLACRVEMVSARTEGGPHKQPVNWRGAGR